MFCPAAFLLIHSSLWNKKQSIMAKTKWSMDSAHSEVRFKIRHLMISWVTGSFQQFSATFQMDEEDLTTAEINFTAEVSSISTNNEQRDAHLRSGDFFDAEKHPQLIFQSSGLKMVDHNEYELMGTLTMRGVSQPACFNVEFGGIIKDPQGNTRAGLTVTGKVSRTKYGITFSRLSETGETLLGEMVTITANAEFLKN
jgi:polyisoprenoid-binding protein YceI